MFRASSVLSDDGADSGADGDDDMANDDDVNDDAASIDLGGDEFDYFRKRAAGFDRRAQLNGFLSPVHQVLQSNDPVALMPALTLTACLDPFDSFCELDGGDEDDAHMGLGQCQQDVHVNVGHPCAATRTGDIAIQGL